jgi:uncharacterized membrane protein YfcA
MDRRSWFLSWLANGSWLIVAVLFGAYVGIPAQYLEAPTLAWAVTLAVIVLALTHLGLRRHGSRVGTPPRREPRGPWRTASKRAGGTREHVAHAPSWYKGRSHSGERPRFD